MEVDKSEDKMEKDDDELIILDQLKSLGKF